AMLDSGSMTDMMSTTLVDQLKIAKEVIAKPLPLHMAVQGSKSNVSCVATAEFVYQDISCQRTFDVVNLDTYDVILGTPFMFQHQVALGLNPARVVIGSAVPLPIVGEEVAVISAAVVDMLEGHLDRLRELLRAEAADLCQDGARTELPPLRAINHTIPLIDETKIYTWRPSKCPEALKPLWRAKKSDYV
ncbi:hypothetical protein K466DRAFT_446438, partial [Polyporus arcularius HHB13444]